MDVRGLGVAVAVAMCLLTGCGEAADDSGAEQSPATSRSRSAAAPTTSAAPTGMELAVQICTEKIDEPDTLVSDAVHGAHDGTRSVDEVAQAFRTAQDGVEALRRQAEAGGLPNLARALKDYEAALGRARVVGDVGLPEITDARAAINIACYSP